MELPKKMTAIRCHKHGDASVLTVDNEVNIPNCNTNSVIIKVAAAGVNYIDTYQRSGLYKVDLPFILGREGAGTVVFIGSEVKNVNIGDRVGFLVEGGYGEYVVVPHNRLINIPNNMSIQLAAAALLQGLTAHYLTTSTYQVKQGDVVLVHAGAGGCGQLLIQMCKMKGARVLTTVGSKEKAEIANTAGADEIILYKEKNFYDEIMRLTETRGVNVVYDGVGKDTYLNSLKSLSPLGHLVLFGNSSGKVPPIDPLDLCNAGSISLTRPNLKDYIASPAALNARSKDLFNWINSGKVKLCISKTFPLSEATSAHRYLESRESAGKILLIVDELIK